MFNEFPFAEVYDLLCDYRPLHRGTQSQQERHDRAAEALVAAHGRWSRQPRKEWSVALLARGGYLDVRDVERQQYRRAVNVVAYGTYRSTGTVNSRGHGDGKNDPRDVAFAAAKPDSDESDGLDNLLHGLDGRDRDIASAWAEGLQDIAVAERIGCSVKTVERTRSKLADRLSRRF